ncbi:hypothetical protein ACTIVE_1826 [Actinomadura verrucosospora]|uniref:Uncharacterized protein n=1 Tax=Actinomadura verrucosospora TaxID=46165 RepID=A0A7D4AM79_ACTVE|nr:hypothetical protein ACTIVE_1826 [Actinomadura verrucosospora]
MPEKMPERTVCNLHFAALVTRPRSRSVRRRVCEVCAAGRRTRRRVVHERQLDTALGSALVVWQSTPSTRTTTTGPAAAFATDYGPVSRRKPHRSGGRRGANWGAIVSGLPRANRDSPRVFPQVRGPRSTPIDHDRLIFRAWGARAADHKPVWPPHPGSVVKSCRLPYLRKFSNYGPLRRRSISP